MCGIFGIISQRGVDASDRQLVRRLANALVHRGPDGEGFAEHEAVCLGMRRLAIIDLAGGWQPLWNESRDLCLVANGEIYNFVELRRDLESRGHRFASGSDCETILHLYEEYGADCVRHLRGMFAFALHDRARGRVLIARDRIGEKPLCIAGDHDRLVFASELRGLVGAGVVPFEIDPEAVNLYLHYGFVPEPWSAVRGVRKLRAGHLIEIQLDPWTVDERCWWRMEDAPAIDADPATTIRAAMDELSPLVVRSDVPVGVALSGGVDSSVVAMLAKRQLGDRLTAFTIGYEGGAWQDETTLAKEFADRVGIDLRVIRLSASAVVDGFGEVCLRRDDPTADLSGSSYYAVMHAARAAGVPVMLMGHGADELFWGYKWMRDVMRRCEAKALLRTGRGGLLTYLAADRPPASWTGLTHWLADGAGFARAIRDWRADRSSDPNQIPPWDPGNQWSVVDRLAPATLACWQEAGRIDPAGIFNRAEFWPRVDIAITKLVSETYNCVNGIAQGDRLSMATSVECRLPFVDYRFIETVIGLRKARPDHHLPPKFWLREAARDLVPSFVFERRKRGFTPPWRRWHQGIFDRYIDALRNGVLVQKGIVRRGAFDDIDSITDAWGRARPLLISMLTLEAWAEGMDALARHAKEGGG